MSSLLVRNLDEKILGRLKSIAKQHGRSLESEVKVILADTASFYTMEEAALVASKWRNSFKGRKLSNSADLIREDRNR